MRSCEDIILNFRYDQEMQKYMKLNYDLSHKYADLGEVKMTTKTKELAAKRLGELIRKIKYAKTEAEMVQRFWTDIFNIVESMGKNAGAVTSYLSDEEKKKKFDYLFDYMKSSYVDWKKINEIAFDITSTFN